MSTPVVVGSKLSLTMFCQDPTTFQSGLMVWAAQVVAVTAGTLTDQDVVDVVDANTGNQAKDCLADDVEYVGWLCRIRTIVPPPVTVVSFVSRDTGQAGGTTSPGQLAALGTLRTNIGGSKGHGRKYFPFVPKSFADENNEMSAAALVNYIAFWGQFVGTINVAGAAGAGRIQFGVTNAAFDHFYPLVQIQNHLGLATQRRRGYYGKQNSSI